MIYLILALIVGTAVRWLFSDEKFSQSSETKQWIGVSVIGIAVCFGLWKAGADGVITYALVATGAFFGKWLAEKASKAV
jgi:hypothetical protein